VGLHTVSSYNADGARLDTPNGSLSLVLPYYDTDLLFLVGGPPSPLYAPNKVVLYSLSSSQAIASIEFASLVSGIAVRRDRLVVVLLDKVVLFALPLGPSAIYREGAYETCANPKGLVGMATEPQSTLLCFPGLQQGQVALVKLPPMSGMAGSEPPRFKDPPFPATSIVLAHTNALSALSTTPNGRFLATSSAKGTLIRLWDSKSGQLLRELRRGTDSATIFSLAVHPLGSAVAAASDKGTVHLWDLGGRRGESATERPRKPSAEGVALLKPFLPKYFSSAWSDAQFRLPPPEPQLPRTLPFLNILAEEKREPALTTEDDRVLVVWTADGALVAITHSGGWFKIGLLDEDRRKAKEDWGAEGRCELLGFNRFESRDGW
jgi:hypothetical protein